MQSQDRAMHYSESRGKNTMKEMHTLWSIYSQEYCSVASLIANQSHTSMVRLLYACMS